MVRGKATLTTIIFDFDGTLAELNIDFASMRKRIVDLIASYTVPMDNVENLFALEMIEAGRLLIERDYPGDSPLFVDRAYELIRDIEIEGARNGNLFDGVGNMLLELRSLNIKTGIVTRNCIEAVKCVCPDIDEYCDVVVTRESTPQVKPHPEQLSLALRALTADPLSAAMVGDHPMDISVGKEVGACAIGVLTGYGHEKMLRDAGADIILNYATQIREILESDSIMTKGKT
ncbi:MAG: HAD family hydrolase [Deltaproteobacteria bacterium]|nr:HAD family hydrolase [Deltaproteobacteria bacterium]